MPFELTIDIDRTVESVFALLADGTKTPLWYEAVRSATRVGGDPSGRGATYRFTRHLPGGDAVNLVQVTEHVPNRAIAFTSLEGPTPFTYRYTLDRAGTRTRVTLEGEITGRGLAGPAALLAPLAPRLFEQGMRHNLHALKRLAESGAETTR